MNCTTNFNLTSAVPAESLNQYKEKKEPGRRRGGGGWLA